MKFILSKIFFLILFISVFIVNGCGTKKVTVKKTPKSNVVFNYQNNLMLSGYPKYPKPWIVFADKDETSIYPNKKYNISDKKSSFKTPYVVLKQKGDMFKVAQYEAGSIVNNKIDQKLIKNSGWLHKNDLLLWNESLRNEINGFWTKGILAINNKYVIENSEKFIQNDSILVYKEPSLINVLDHKLSFNDIVYIYKFSDDSKKALIGSTSILDIENADKEIIGWIDTQMVTIWGERTSFKINPLKNENEIQIGIENQIDSITYFKPIISSNKLQNQNNIGAIFPINYKKESDDFEIKFLDNVLDYSENKIYNVLGDPIYYNDYLNILKNNKKLNIVLLIDGLKENLKDLSTLKSLIQNLDVQIAEQNYFNNVTYSALYYNVSKDYKKYYVSFSENYNDLTNVLDVAFFSKGNNIPAISLNESINELNQLFQSKSNETNLVVIIGNKIEESDRINQSTITSKLAKINSKIIFYQLKARKANDYYNDFVLFGENTLKETSKIISNFKKQKIVRDDDVLNLNEFDLSRGIEGVYRLDYPFKNMNQGAIVFPQKGEENSTALLQNVIQITMNDIVNDNVKIDSTLITLFKSPLGVSRTKIKKEYKPLYEISQPYVSVDLALQLIDKKYPFIQKGKLVNNNEHKSEGIEYGVLLNENELEQVQNFYLSVYANTFKNDNINNKKLIRRFMSVVRDKSLLQNGVTRKFLRQNTMPIDLFQSTGIYLSNPDSLSLLKLNDWKREKNINLTILQNYFKEYKIITNKILEEKGSENVLVSNNGAKLYWLSSKFLPELNLEPIIDKTPRLENKQIKEKSNSKKYIERVKKGIP